MSIKNIFKEIDSIIERDPADGSKKKKKKKNL